MATKSAQRGVIALIAVIIAISCLGNLSQTALNAMLISVSQDLGVTTAQGQWATTIYMLVLGVAVPVVPFLMRRFALKKVIVSCALLMLVGSLIDWMAPGFEILVVGRVLQAISAGITVPMLMSVIMQSFPPERRGGIMGIAGIAMGFSPNVGPTVGGLFVDLWGWRSFFAALLVLSVVLSLCSVLLSRGEDEVDPTARLDFVSLLLSTFGLGGLLLGFSNASSFGLVHVLVWGPVVLGAGFFGLFLRRQRRVAHPLIDLRIMDSWRYRAGFWSMNLLWASFMCVTLITPLFIQNVQGGSALDAGFALLVGAAVALVGNPVAGFACDRFGARPVVCVASVFLVAGAVPMVAADVDMPFWLIVVLQGVRQAGVSCLISPMNTWSMGDLPGPMTSDASSFATVVRQAAASFATAIAVFFVTSASGAAGSAALGYQLAFGLSAICALAVAAINIAKVR
ncbi:MAG: MFS transporter [Coriobacteriia bacterium]|nr:MFS transporter [Coriobacteriia bacterium]